VVTLHAPRTIKRPSSMSTRTSGEKGIIGVKVEEDDKLLSAASPTARASS